MKEEDKKILEEIHGELYEDLVRVYAIRTICEVLREIYWGIEDQDVKLKVKEAIVLAKKMNNRLIYYWEKANPGKPKSEVHEGIFQLNPFSDQVRKEKERLRLEQALKEANEDNRTDVRKG